MARFVLLPCRVFQDRFTRSGAAQLTLDLKQLVELLKPEAAHLQGTIRNLRALKAGAYTGTIRGALTGGLVPFVLCQPVGAQTLRWILDRDPGMLSRVVTVYEAVSVTWDGVVQELQEGAA